MSSKKSIVYTYSKSSSFIEKDIQILEEEFHVIRDTRNWNNKFLFPINVLAQFFSLLFKARKTDTFIIMFAGHWSVVPVFIGKLFKRKSYIILGGTDCVSFPSIHYGALRKKNLKRSIKYSVTRATKLLPVARELIYQDYSYDSRFSKHQGLKHYFPNLETPFTEIPNGYDIEGKDQELSIRKPFSFITVAVLNDSVRFQLKGLDLLKKMAHQFPEATFTVVGISELLAKEHFVNASNIISHSFVPHSEIDHLMKTHEFYLQLSISEGHPNALCEGMINGCIPIGSNVSSIPRIIGETGYILSKRDSAELSNIFNDCKKLSTDEKAKKSMLSRQQIISNFPLKLRSEMLMKEINS